MSEVKFQIAVKELTVTISGEPATLENLQTAIANALTVLTKTTKSEVAPKVARKPEVVALAPQVEVNPIEATIVEPIDAEPKRRGRPRKNPVEVGVPIPRETKAVKVPKVTKAPKVAKAPKPAKESKVRAAAAGRPGRPTGLRPGSCAYQINQLMELGFLAMPKTLKEVQDELLRRGFDFGSTNINQILYQLNNRRELTREKVDGVWTYTKA